MCAGSRQPGVARGAEKIKKNRPHANVTRRVYTSETSLRCSVYAQRKQSCVCGAVIQPTKRWAGLYNPCTINLVGGILGPSESSPPLRRRCHDSGQTLQQ